MADWAFSPWFSAQRHARPEEKLRDGHPIFLRFRQAVLHCFTICNTSFHHCLSHRKWPRTSNDSNDNWGSPIYELKMCAEFWPLAALAKVQEATAVGRLVKAEVAEEKPELNAICCQQGCCSAGAIIIQHTTYGVYVHPGPSYHIQ